MNMKGTIALIAFLAVAAGVARAESRTSKDAPVIDTCTVLLTKQQQEQVKASRGQEVTVNLTKDQKKAMHIAFPGWKGTSVKITTGNVGHKGQVLFWRDRVMEANPQPSPYPVPEDLQRLIE